MVEERALTWLYRGMSKFSKLSVQVPELVRERFTELDHGQKQLACTAGLLWYFSADAETQLLYRTWAQTVADGHATVEDPPAIVKAALRKGRPKPPARRKR